MADLSIQDFTEGWENIDDPNEEGWENVPEPKGKLRRAWDFLTTTPKSLQKYNFPRTTPEDIANTPAASILPGYSLAEKLATKFGIPPAPPKTTEVLPPNVINKIESGLYNVGVDVANSMMTPLGAATLPLGLTSGLLRKAAGLGLTGLTVPGIYHGAKEAITSEGEPEKLAHGIGTTLAGGLGTLGGYRLMKGEPTPIVSEPKPKIAGLLPELSESTLAEFEAAREKIAEFPPARVPRKMRLPEEIQSELESSGQVHEMPPSPLAPRIPGYRVPVEPFVERPIPAEVSPEFAKAKLEEAGELSKSLETQGKEQPYVPPTVKTDLRQLEKQMQEGTISTKETRFAPVEYIGEQEGFGKIPSQSLYNLTENVPGLGSKGSTLSKTTIEKAGYKVPERTKPFTSEEQEPTTLYSNPLLPVLKDAKRALTFFRPSIQKINSDYGVEGKVVAPAMTKFYQDMHALRGRWYGLPEYEINNLLSPVEQFTGRSQALNNVRDYLWDLEDFGRSQIQLNPLEKDIATRIRVPLNDVRTQIARRPGLRQPTTPNNPNYLPQTMKFDKIEIVGGETNTPEFLAAKQEYLDYQTNVRGVTPQVAEQRWNFVHKAYSELMDPSNKGAQFGPIDKSEGYGIPRSWREEGLMNILDHYFSRAARRIAYHDNFETNPTTQQALEVIRKPNTETDLVMRNIEGRETKSDVFWEAATGAVKSGIMGTLSGAKDVISTTMVQGLQYQIPSQYIPGYIKGWVNVMDGLKAGLQEGVIQRNKGFFEANQGTLVDAAGTMRSIQNIANKVQLRSLADRMSRAHQMATGQYVLMSNFSRVLSGRGGILPGQIKQATSVLDKFIPDWRTYTTTGVLPQEVLQKGAARYVESVSGTYDPRGIPIELMHAREFPIGTLMTWDKWSIDKANNLIQDVIKPMKQGNLYPLLGLAFGTLLGGSAIVALTQVISGRKSQTPTFKELQETPEATTEDYLWRISAIADAAGFGGKFSSLMKSALDLRQGNLANPQVGNPLLDSLQKNFEIFIDAASAYKETGNEDIILRALEDFFANQFQDYRLLQNQFIRADELDISNMMRDYRVWQQLTDVEEAPTKERGAFNPYTNLAQRELQRAKDMQSYGENLQGLEQQALAQETPLEKMRGIESLKRLQAPQLMPSTNKAGIRELYLDWLNRTGGDTGKVSNIQEFQKDMAKEKNKYLIKKYGKKP